MTDIDRTAALEAMTWFGSWLELRQTYARVPGIQAAFLLGDEVLWSGAWGHADVETGTALTSDHLFRIASHSKTFTATAVLQLAEQGRLRLDDTASGWLPQLGGTRLGTVTLRELLAHGGGITRDGADGDHWQLAQPFPDADGLLAISLAAGADVLPANERFKYSNIGYSLLGQVIEAASGQTYAAYVQEQLLDPLALAHTGPELRQDLLGDYATGYSALGIGEGRVPIEHVDTRAMAAATGFYGTATDVVRWFAAHFMGDLRVLSDASKRAMQQQQWESGAEDRAYALGLALTTIGDRTLIGHGGGYPGHITVSLADVEDRFALSVFTNAIDGPAGELAAVGVRLVDLAVKHKARQSPVPAGDLARFTGRFADLWGITDIAVLGGRLLMLRPTLANPAASVVELEPVDDHTLRMAGSNGFGTYGEPVTFDFEDGRVRSVRLESGLTSVPLAEVRLPARVTAR